MRVRLVALAAILLIGPVLGQDEKAEPELPVLTNPHNYIKLMAQEAALPSLQGEDRFILRESWWSGNLAPGKAKLIQVQLFRRNSYRFWMAVPSRDGEPLLNVYDSEGALVPSETFTHEGQNIVSTVISPESTGGYYLRVSLKTTIENPQDWAVVYAWR